MSYKSDKLLLFLHNTFWRVREYLYYGNFRKKHLSFSFSNGKFQITSLNHDDYIAIAQKKINALAKDNNLETFIKLSLIEATNGCNFIIFSPLGEKYPFIQFWTAGHNLKFNFTANKINKLKKYYLPIIGLLSQSGFVNDLTKNYSGFDTYKITKSDDSIYIDAKFHKSFDLAAKLTATIFRDIYQSKNKKIVAQVE